MRADEKEYNRYKKTESSSTKESAKGKKGPEIDGLTYESAMDLEYAEGFQVYYYKDGYKMIDIKDDAKFLARPGGPWMCRMELMRIT